MNVLRVIWLWFLDLFSLVGSTHPKIDTPPAQEEEEPIPSAITRALYSCEDGTPVPEDYWHNLTKLYEAVETLSLALDTPVTIVDAYRTPSYNKHIGAPPTSTHLECLGVDLCVDGLTPEELASKIKRLMDDGEITKGGLSVYPEYVHYDIRGEFVTWEGYSN